MAAAEAAGSIAGQAMGLGFAGSVDPTHGESVLPTAYLLDSLGAHEHYDMGMIAVVSGDAAVARAEADTILKAAPSHLLGLILGMKAAGLRNDAPARAALQKRFDAALPDASVTLADVATLVRTPVSALRTACHIAPGVGDRFRLRPRARHVLSEADRVSAAEGQKRRLGEKPGHLS